jgi:succinoglycan biosynthesis transport protein ExoP
MENSSTPPSTRRIDPTESESGQFFATYVEPLLAHKWIVLAVTLVAATGTTFWTLQQPKIYEAGCTIEYDPNPPRPLGAAVEDVVDPVGAFWSTREFFETQHRILGSRLLADRVIARLNLQESAASLQGRISIEPLDRSRLVMIRVRDRDPERAAQIANTIADTYIQKTIDDRRTSSDSALVYLESQLNVLRDELSTSELALHQFKEEHNVLSLSMEDRQNLIAGEIEHFSEALTQVRTRRVELSSRAQRLRAALHDGEVEDQAAALNSTSAPSIAAMREALRAKLSERDMLTLRYGEAHPRMRALDEEIAALREQLGREITGFARAAEADLAEAQATERGLRTLVDDAQAAGLDLNLREIEYERLNRQRGNNEKMFSLVLERFAEARLTQGAHATHVRMLDRALPPTSHVSPRVPVNVGAGLGAGLALGIALAFALSRLDRRIKSAEDAERLGANVLGVLPVIEGAKDEKRTSKRRPRRRAEGSPRDLIVHTQPMSAAAEGFRGIRTNLSFMDVDGDIRALVVTSADPEEGKTTVAANLAISFAQSGKRVLIVDTDLRRPRIHHAFGISHERGVSSVLIGASTFAESVQETDIPNLSVLPCGPIPPNPAELLHHRRFRDLIQQARSQFDLVVFDSPPVGVVTDAAVIAPQVDGVLLVARAEATTRDALRTALRQFRTVGAKLFGMILNGVDPRRGSYGYRTSYYGGRGYYADAARDDLESDRAAAE